MVTSACRSCGAPIVWVRTDSDKLMPIDPEPVEGGLLILWGTRSEPRVTVARSGAPPFGHRAHFATCPDAESWRRR